jgi:hypothetical protein
MLFALAKSYQAEPRAWNPPRLLSVSIPPLLKNHPDFADPTRGVPTLNCRRYLAGLGILFQTNEGQSAAFDTDVTERGLYR